MEQYDRHVNGKQKMSWKPKRKWHGAHGDGAEVVFKGKTYTLSLVAASNAFEGIKPEYRGLAQRYPELCELAIFDVGPSLGKKALLYLLGGATAVRLANNKTFENPHMSLQYKTNEVGWRALEYAAYAIHVGAQEFARAGIYA